MDLDKVIGAVNATYTCLDFDFEFEWTIENFCMSCKNVGDAVYSPEFTTKFINHDIEWFMKFFPKGNSDDYKDYLSIFLHANAKISAIVTFIIFNSKHEVKVSRTMPKHLFHNSAWGYPDFILRSFVQNPANGILDSDKLTIGCKIKYKNCQMKSAVPLDSKGKPQEVEVDIPHLELEAYEALLDDGKFSDVSLVSQDRTVKAHKCILAAKSPVFAELFAGKKDKCGETIEIPDIGYQVLLEMLRFMYAGKINNFNSLAVDLAVAAEKYELMNLKFACERVMRKNLSLNNVNECLKMADKMCMDKLKKDVIELIVDNAKFVDTKLEFHLLSHDTFRDIFRSMAKKNK